MTQPNTTIRPFHGNVSEEASPTSAGAWPRRASDPDLNNVVTSRGKE